LRELRALQNRLYDCTKFDKLIRYCCANLFFLVLPEELFRDSEIPVGWGALVESDGALTLMCKPVWQETAVENRVRLLQRIAMAGTRGGQSTTGNDVRGYPEHTHYFVPLGKDIHSPLDSDWAVPLKGGPDSSQLSTLIGWDQKIPAGHFFWLR
jgi:hypothetical protein